MKKAEKKKRAAGLGTGLEKAVEILALKRRRVLAERNGLYASSEMYGRLNAVADAIGAQIAVLRRACSSKEARPEKPVTFRELRAYRRAAKSR